MIIVFLLEILNTEIPKNTHNGILINEIDSGAIINTAHGNTVDSIANSTVKIVQNITNGNSTEAQTKSAHNCQAGLVLIQII